MAGYDHAAWKSNNALAAEQAGLMTAGRIAQVLKVSKTAVERFLPPAERHHVSGAYNLVNYYKLTAVSDSQLACMRRADAGFYPHSITSATIKWLEWPAMRVGRFARRGRPSRPIEREATDCRVSYPSRATAIVLFADGRTMTKRTTSTGFEVLCESESQRQTMD